MNSRVNATFMKQKQAVVCKQNMTVLTQNIAQVNEQNRKPKENSNSRSNPSLKKGQTKDN